MGTKERRERERQEIRQAILSSARQIATEEGWPAVTTRKVADRIEYSQPTIYEYFENKEAILLALLSQGFEQVLTELRQARTQHAQPDAQLLAMTQTYWNFAFRCPELYQVMFGLGGVSFTHAQTPPDARASFALFRDTLHSWMEQREIESVDLDGKIDALWASMHGLITLTMIQRIAGGEPRAQRVREQTIRDLLRAWQAPS